MEISILHPKGKAENQKTVTFVKKAVRNLGISARITEQETGMSAPRIVVDGFDLMTGFENDTSNNNETTELSYKLIETALERSAWAGF
ncbi:MAG: hypothetical protein GY865_15035 [candidate division Zixibacteria bacterium]|nr:hypothetical protein [candidate division Zixibacteria bacterium]